MSAEPTGLTELEKDLLAALQEGYALMAKVEESAVEHVLYDGRPVEEWCAQARAAIVRAEVK